jgi:hypothetical protein
LDVLFRVQLQTKYSPTKSEQSQLIKQIEISLQVLLAASELYKLRKQPQNESKINEVHTEMQNNFNKTLDAACMAISKSTMRDAVTVNLTQQILHFYQFIKQHNLATEAILDSGAGVHLSDDVQADDDTHRIMVAGFDGSTQCTKGTGSLSCFFEDAITSENFNYTIKNINKISGTKTLISLGLLIRAGFTFHVHSVDEILLYTPQKRHCIKGYLKQDNILYISYTLQQPKQSHYANKRTIQEASYSTLHSIFNHCGFVKLQHTMEHVSGLTLPADGIKDCFCETCAMARAKRKGLSKKVSVNPAVPVGDVSFDHDDDLYLPPGPDYVVDSPGESFSADGFINRGHDLHRYDVAKLRPFEVMYCDNFDYPCPVRGGKLTGFVMVCLKTFAIFKVDVKSKAHNGRAFRKLVADEGIHKLPYKCTIYADNCGSMVHVSQTATSLGINFQPLPPKDQSLNLAEKAIDIVVHAAVGHLLQSKRHSKYFPQAVDFACYSHNRMATTALRGWITPFEALKGCTPDVSHMWSFGTVCYVVVDKPNRPHHKGTMELEQPAVKGIFLGFHTMWDDTYKATTDEIRGTVVHSRHITFNRDTFDYSDIGGPLSHSSMPQSELIELVHIPQFRDSEEAHDDAAPAEAEEANGDVSPAPAASTHDPISPPQQKLPSQNDSLEPESIQQPQLPNGVDSPISSFHFPPNVPNNGPGQQNIQQQDSPKDAELLPPQNISASENDSQPPNTTEVQLEINPAFDGVRRSTRERTNADHPDAEYFRTIEKEKEKHDNYFRQLELQRQANSACLSNSQHANYDTCLQAENTHLAFEEAQHFGYSLTSPSVGRIVR